MHIGQNYTFQEVLKWTRKDIYFHVIIAIISLIFYKYLNCTWIAVPWLPIALLGTAVAFVVGFKNNASYDRLWEARKIWGSILNASRSFGMMINSFIASSEDSSVSPEELADIKFNLVKRHLAWITALRYQLREKRPWESIYKEHNEEYKNKWFVVEEQNSTLKSALEKYLSSDEIEKVNNSTNKATQIISIQSKSLESIQNKNYIEHFRYLEINDILQEFYNLQGGCERIKNFPYPRQFATTNLWFIKIFIVLIPLGMLQEFGKLPGEFIWLMVPFSALSGWIFTTLEKIGESSENPFEGAANDVPITALSRTIEIDLYDIIGIKHELKPITPQHQILL
ncbi:MAG: multidrug transporter [Saprospiraceae bacterium]|nr:multidrug transporter [Saprospiraceae bacterium]